MSEFKKKNIFIDDEAASGSSSSPKSVFFEDYASDEDIDLPPLSLCGKKVESPSKKLDEFSPSLSVIPIDIKKTENVSVM
jgi:hypothetical protein